MAQALLILAVLASSASTGTRVQAATALRPSKTAVARQVGIARALCEQTRWGEAVAAFEEAAESAPGDARILSELGWAAFRAGDHAKARGVLEGALGRARDPAVKASILYNLGRVDEAAGKPAAAARRYRASLALRTSDAAAARLWGVESRPDEPLPIAGADRAERCVQPRRLDELCACVAASVNGDEDDEDRTCELRDEVPAPAHRVLFVRVRGMEYLFLVHARGGAWSLAGELADLWSPGAWGRHGQLEEVTATRETWGGRDLLRVLVRSNAHDEDLGVGEVSSEQTERETLCVLDAPDEASRCVLSVPIRTWTERMKLSDADALGTEERERPRRRTEGLPIRWQRTLRVDVKKDGVAQVVLVEGPEPQDVTLGLHRLW